MNLWYVLAVIVLGGGNLFGHDHALMKNLQSRYIRTIRSTDIASARIVAQSFETLARYHKQAKVKDLLESPYIKQLFDESLHRSSDQHVSDSVRSAQYNMLLHLYLTMFYQYIKSAEGFLNGLIGAKKYWFYEDFYMSQALYRRHPVYSIYSSAYKNTVQCRLALLEDLERQVAHMLGICLYGAHKITAIEREDQVVESLMEAIKPLYNVYHAPYPVEDIQTDPAQLFRDLSWIYGTMDQHMDHVKTVLRDNNKPSFAAEHWFGLSCAAAAVLVSYIVYKNHEEDVPGLQRKAVSSVKYVWNDYVRIPVHDLIDVLWYNQGKKIGYIEPLEPLEEANVYDPRLWLFNLAWNQRVLPFINPLLASFKKTCDKKVDEANDLFMKNQQVNLALAAIGPVLFGVYLVSKYSKASYNRFVKHDNWYAPMKYSLRAADQLVNSVVRNNQHSFADDGKLYMLVMNVQQYISCLSNEELILMRTDLDDLLSFDLTYKQKHSVIERMYRTYQFLK